MTDLGSDVEGPGSAAAGTAAADPAMGELAAAGTAATERAAADMVAAATRLGHHLPHRPDWRCPACDTDWPCPVARCRLADVYRLTPLPVTGYLRNQARIAAADLGHTPSPGYVPAGFHTRFLGWLRPDDLP